VNLTTVGVVGSGIGVTFVSPDGLLSLPIGMILTSLAEPGVTVNSTKTGVSPGTLLFTIIVLTLPLVIVLASRSFFGIIPSSFISLRHGMAGATVVGACVGTVVVGNAALVDTAGSRVVVVMTVEPGVTVVVSVAGEPVVVGTGTTVDSKIGFIGEHAQHFCGSSKNNFNISPSAQVCLVQIFPQVVFPFSHLQ